ncbi:MAG TPA: TIGR02221 family CRISPR-associated protein [Desulfobacteraceae bacterium]|nr:TIGR02221 family CRISPR-associated protein [Desulfobacteraceae bacterium]
MRRVFLSFLGTTDYEPVNYQYPTKQFSLVENIRFVQEALVGWYCSEWSEQDKIIILTTGESCSKNWQDDGHRDRNGNPLLQEGLRTRLKKLAYSADIMNRHIPSGRSEKEIWEIFEIIREQIQEGDELYIDITHAFRSLPLLAMVTLNYAKVLQSVTVRAIDYGALEAVGDIQNIKNMPLEKRNIPVFGLLPFDQLLEWTQAFDRFLGSGDAKPVATAASRAIRPILKECRGQNAEVKGLERLAKNLACFSATMTTCRGRNIVEVTSELKKSLDSVLHQQTIKPLSPMLHRLNDSISRFSGDEINDGITAARWCTSHNLVQQGFTILEETATSFIVAKALSEDINDLTARKLVNQAVAIFLKNTSQDDWKDEAKEHPDKINRILEWLGSQKELADMLRELSNYRNDLNHAGHSRENPMQAEKFPIKLDEMVAFFEGITTGHE